jgi:hypothetical protein
MVLLLTHWPLASKIESVIENWVEGLIGLWILLSPWMLGFAGMSIAKWSSVLCGLVIVLMNAWNLFGKKQD